MKKLIAIVLLLCISVQIWGYHLYFTFQRAFVKSEVKAMLRNKPDEASTTKFAFNTGNKEDRQLMWEDEHEFRYNGEMYDVIEKRTVDGVLQIRCISDKAETALVQHYKGLLNDDFSNAPQKKMNSLKKIFSALFEKITLDEAPVYPGTNSLSFRVYKSILSPVHREVPTPPPLSFS